MFRAKKFHTKYTNIECFVVTPSEPRTNLLLLYTTYLSAVEGASQERLVHLNSLTWALHFGPPQPVTLASPAHKHRDSPQQCSSPNKKRNLQPTATPSRWARAAQRAFDLVTKTSHEERRNDGKGLSSAFYTRTLQLVPWTGLCLNIRKSNYTRVLICQII